MVLMRSGCYLIFSLPYNKEKKQGNSLMIYLNEQKSMHKHNKTSQSVDEFTGRLCDDSEL